MRALVLAGLLLCSLTSHAQLSPAFIAVDKWLEEAGDPSIKTSFGLAAVFVGGTAVPGPPGQEGPFGRQRKSDGLIGLGTIDVAIDAPFDARGSVTAGLGFFRGDGFANPRDALFEPGEPPQVLMFGGFRDMLTVTGPGTGPGTVSAFGRTGDTTGDGAFLLTYSASGALLDSDNFRSSGSAGSFQLTVDAPPGAQVLLIMEHLFERLDAVQGGPPLSTRFDLAVNRFETSEGLSVTAASGGLQAVDGGYVYAPIPEPSTTALMLAGLLIILGTCSARMGTRRSVVKT
jgi:hypothetical protein